MSEYLNEQIPNRLLWWSTDGDTAVPAPHSPLDFQVLGDNKNMVYECIVNRIDKIHQIFNAARHMNDIEVLCKVQIILNFIHT